jgi:hypothetical protein
MEREKWGTESLLKNLSPASLNLMQNINQKTLLEEYRNILPPAFIIEIIQPFTEYDYEYPDSHCPIIYRTGNQILF